MTDQAKLSIKNRKRLHDVVKLLEGIADCRTNTHKVLAIDMTASVVRELLVEIEGLEATVKSMTNGDGDFIVIGGYPDSGDSQGGG